ncbi:MAG: DeoR/GlpR family DNA-binding transcription regulator [Collinsella sp.]|nr:DeoR/GlpR family DNA-binding transcription regulator [Collinsella sp.]
MIKVERQNMLKRIIGSQGTVSIKELVEALGVSDVTIRRDLEELASAGEIVRVHGGARIASPQRRSMLRHELSHLEKRGQHAEEKIEIARTAVSLIEEDSTVFLGTGTTIEQMVPLLPSFHLRVITNSQSVFTLLEPLDHLELCLIGGAYRRRTTAFVGPVAEDAMSAIGVDVAFIGANGIYGDAVSTSNMDEGRLQQLALDQADTRYLVADSSKVGRRDFYTFYSLSRIDAVICESGVDAEVRARLEEHTKVICEPMGA